MCSYKGGDPGFVSVLDDRTLAFPSYDGNGMFLSTGNVAEARGVDLLFIDFEERRRSRRPNSPWTTPCWCATPEPNS